GEKRATTAMLVSSQVAPTAGSLRKMISALICERSSACPYIPHILQRGMSVLGGDFSIGFNENTYPESYRDRYFRRTPRWASLQRVYVSGCVSDGGGG